jgi:protein O-mannosyl-transferase
MAAASITLESSHRPAALPGALVIIALTLLAYTPAMSAGFIWDDDQYVWANPLLQQGWDGLSDIWTPRKTPQYYPAVFTMFWIENQIWGLNPHGYHVVNIVLHALNAVLVWRLALMLRIPWPWLIGAVFALHPVHVESVAWITERKNTLSGLFYLLGGIAYLRFDEDAVGGREEASKGRWWFYAASFVCFVLALLSKSVTCSLPAALILMMLWQRKRDLRVSPAMIGFSIATLFCIWLESRGINLPLAKGRSIAFWWLVAFASIVWIAVAPRRSRLEPLMPFFIIGLILALNTAHIEREHVKAIGPDFDFSVFERCAIASRALLFYPAQIVWPVDLMFIYPRWNIAGSDWRTVLPVAGVITISLVLLWMFLRGWSGVPLAAAFFAGTIFPALGFVNVYPMIFSFVADHFAYLASLGIIAIAIGGIGWLRGRERRMEWLAAAVLLPILALLTWRQALMYHDLGTLWRATFLRNPDAWIARSSLAPVLWQEAEMRRIAGREDQARDLLLQAREHAEAAYRMKPDHPPVLVTLSESRRLAGAEEEAIEPIRKAIALVPADANYRWQLGRLCESLGRVSEAAQAHREAVERDPDSIVFRASLAVALVRGHQFAAAQMELDALAAQVQRQTTGVGPTDMMFVERLADALAEREQWSAAAQAYDLAAVCADRLGVTDRSSELRDNAGRCREREGRP